MDNAPEGPETGRFCGAELTGYPVFFITILAAVLMVANLPQYREPGNREPGPDRSGTREMAAYRADPADGSLNNQLPEPGIPCAQIRQQHQENATGTAAVILDE